MWGLQGPERVYCAPVLKAEGSSWAFCSREKCIRAFSLLSCFGLKVSFIESSLGCRQPPNYQIISNRMTLGLFECCPVKVEIIGSRSPDMVLLLRIGTQSVADSSPNCLVPKEPLLPGLGWHSRKCLGITSGHCRTGFSGEVN